MKLVFLDTKTIGEDIDLSLFDALGTVVKYEFTSEEEAAERIGDGDVVILNKVKINRSTLGNAPNLKLVCMTGTGTNHIDKTFLEERGIAWRNVVDYSTESVTQHTFTLLFYLLGKTKYYDDYVKSGSYVEDTSFSHFAQNFHELFGMTFGIIGLGNIGRRVATIATAFGAKVIYYSPSGAPPQEGYTQVDWNTLLETSDIISIHAPLSEHTENLIDRAAFQKMKRSAILLNLGRGPIVSEDALLEALETEEIAAAGIDVLAQEPMTATNPLLKIQDSSKLLITPHIAWASVESRTRLMSIILNQVKEFFCI